MKLILLLSVVALACGCARFTTTQTDISYDENGKAQRTIKTRAAAWTAFEAKSALASFKASQTDKTQNTTVGALNQEVSSTNFAVNLGAFTEFLKAIPR